MRKTNSIPQNQQLQQVADISLPILCNFQKYTAPKKGIFAVLKPNGKYSCEYGWETELEECTIIGEDTTSYVYKLQPSEQGKWVGNNVIIQRFILPIGIHKSRLVRWTSGQLALF